MADPNWEEKGEVLNITPITRGGIFGIGEKKYNRVLFQNGEMWDIPDDPAEEAKYVGIDRDTATAWRAATKRPPAPTVKQDEYGNPVIWDPEASDPRTGKKGAFVPAPGMLTKPPPQENVFDDEGNEYRYDVDYYNPSTGQQGRYAPAPPPTKSPYASDFTQGGIRYRLNKEGIPQEIFRFPTTPTAGRTRFAEEEEYDRLRAQQLRMEIEGATPLTPFQQATLGQQKARADYEQQQDEWKRQQSEQETELRRMQSAWQMANQIGQQQAQLAPYALLPGQEYFLGHGPGSAAQANAARLRLPYNPEQFRVPVQTWDPWTLWEQANERYGGGR